MKYLTAGAIAVAACASPVPGAGSADGGPDATGSDAGNPPPFWDTSNIPPAQHVMTFKFLNRTNGKFPDSAVYWSFQSGAIDELHSIAEQPTYDMPANASGRMYLYLCAPGDPTNCTEPRKSKYFDFLEHTIGTAQYNGNTTRVDAFGLKLAMRLHCADGFEATVGEDLATFTETREDTFAAYLASVPPAFQTLAQAPNGPYRIVQPGAGPFGSGGTEAGYYDGFVDALWSANGITIAKPGPNGDGLRDYPDLEAAIFRHVGAVAGSFHADGSIANTHLFDDATTFYGAAPADYYARFWHQRGYGGKAYGFPYDDAGGYSTYLSHANPQYMLVAIGW